MLPDYFFEAPASTSGRNHPPYALGPGGLVRHVKSATHIGHDLLNLEMYGRYAPDEKDLMVVSILLHDGTKQGLSDKGGNYAEKHPVICAEWIRNTNELSSMLQPDQIEFLCGCVASHMGSWAYSYRTKEQILPKPKTAAQRFVHICDYLASRKYLIFDFGDDYYTPENKESEPKFETPADKLAPIISEIVDVCKTKIETGVDRNVVYQIIKENNNGNRNPNSITDAEAAKNVLSLLSELTA